MTHRGKRFSQHTPREQGKYNLQLLSPLSPPSGLRAAAAAQTLPAPRRLRRGLFIIILIIIYCACTETKTNRRANRYNKKSPPPPCGPQVECSNSSSREAVGETGKFQPNLAVLIITVIMTTSRRQGEEHPNKPQP